MCLFSFEYPRSLVGFFVSTNLLHRPSATVTPHFGLQSSRPFITPISAFASSSIHLACACASDSCHTKHKSICGPGSWSCHTRSALGKLRCSNLSPIYLFRTGKFAGQPIAGQVETGLPRKLAYAVEIGGSFLHQKERKPWRLLGRKREGGFS